MIVSTPAADRQAQLDDLLSRWHHWQSSARVGKGHANKALVCGDYRVSRQYDSDNGALDSEIEARTMKAVQSAVDRMADPHRAAIYVIARAINLGTSAVSSPRLPQDRAEREAVIAQARVMLIQRLRQAEVIL
jgi:hypothetical protein